MSLKTNQSKKTKTYSKGGQRTFRGRDLLQIAMPLGGIGAGCICLNGYGGLQDFSIRHTPATSAGADRHVAQDAGFALLHLQGTGQTRLVEGPFPPEKIYNLGLKIPGLQRRRSRRAAALPGLLVQGRVSLWLGQPLRPGPAALGDDHWLQPLHPAG